MTQVLLLPLKNLALCPIYKKIILRIFDFQKSIVSFVKTQKFKNGGGNCIILYPRGQIAKIHLHFNTPTPILKYTLDILYLDL